VDILWVFFIFYILGAGVAALVTYLLRKDGFENAISYCYSAPGGLLSHAASILFDEFSTSVVCGDDIVSRLSRHCLDLLKYDLKRVLSQCKIHKSGILNSIIYNFFSGMSEKTRTLIAFRKHSEKPICLEKIIAENQRLPLTYTSGYSGINLSEVSKAIPTFMPGKILYLEKIRDFGGKYNSELTPTVGVEIKSLNEHKTFIKRGNESLNNLKKLTQAQFKKASTIPKSLKNLKYVYVPRWADRYEFQQTIVSATMLSDHLPFEFMKQFEEMPASMALRTTS
jgi:hypothetical protein